ncbi:retrotransposon protein, putative, ty3-gypsy subclass [Tanacetum coccineum]
MTQILTKGEAFKDDQYILATQVKQCFYLEDMAKRQPHWKVVEHVNHKKFSYEGVIVVEEDPDMSADVARGHNGDGGSDDRKGTRKPNLGGRKAGRLHTRQETRNLGLKTITDDKGPVPIWFEWDDKKTLMPFGDHATHWSNYLGELIREMPLYYPSWRQVPAERKAAILAKIRTQFDLKPHMQSQRWTDINAGIQQHSQKLYNTNKAFLKATHWIAFWNDPRNQARAAQNRQNRAKSTVVCRQGSRSLARLRDHMMESSATREYPSLIDTFFVTHTVGGVFTRDEDRAIYEEMLRLQGLGSNTPSGVPYTEEEINVMARKGKSDDKFSQLLTQYESSPEFGNANGSGGCGDDEMADDEDGEEDEEDEEDGDK